MHLGNSNGPRVKLRPCSAIAQPSAGESASRTPTLDRVRGRRRRGVLQSLLRTRVRAPSDCRCNRDVGAAKVIDHRVIVGTFALLSAEVFAGHVRDALAHLYDRRYLRTHPLGSLLGDDRPISEDELRRRLLKAVESLRPPIPCPSLSPVSR